MPAPEPLTPVGKVLAVARQRLVRQDEDLVLFNSFQGRHSDNPRAVAEELVRRGTDHRALWLRSPGAGFPPDVDTVEPRSPAYLAALGRARTVVGNTTLPLYVGRGSVTYVQTWHGTPLKKIGFDNPRRAADPEGLARAVRDWKQWDFLVTQNAYSSDKLARAFRFEGEVLEIGYPRNDLLSSPEAPQVRRRVREELGIPEGKTVVLYAPTFRDDQGDRADGLDFALALDLDRMQQALGEDVVVLLRLHYWVSPGIADRAGDFTRNVSGYPDIRDLYLAADVLLTDYSSCMFDFSVTRKPMVLFTYDLESYRDDVRGCYFDITEQAPGPLCRTTDEVIAALGDLSGLQRTHAREYAEFAERYSSLDDGQASARLVDRVWGG